jgi:uncharacterized protein YraI
LTRVNGAGAIGGNMPCMKHRILQLCAVAACALGFATTACAQQFATTSKSVHLRAGPGRDYPVVAVLAPQTGVTVFGCLSSYLWCDVAAGPERGWVYANNLLYAYDNREVILPSVATAVGIGIMAFMIDDYWHDHYVGRSWYPQRRRWIRPAPPPAPHVGRPQAPHVEPGPQDRPPQRVAPAPRDIRQPHVEPGPQDRPAPSAQPHQVRPQAPGQRKRD